MRELSRQTAGASVMEKMAWFAGENGGGLDFQSDFSQGKHLLSSYSLL